MNSFSINQKCSLKENAVFLIGLLAVVAFILPMTGCAENALEKVADDDTFEAKLEEARIALDNRKYEEAREQLMELLEENPESDIVRQYLSNSWSGLAGLDVVNLLETIDKLDETGDSGNIGMFGEVLGDADGTILRERVFDIVEKLDTAFITMDEINLLKSLNKDQIIQLGIVGASHIAVVITEIIMNDRPELNQITMTDDGIHSIYEESPPDFDEEEAEVEKLEEISRDLLAIAAAIEELGRRDDNELAEDLAVFIEEIDPDGSGTVTRDELEEYVESR